MRHLLLLALIGCAPTYSIAKQHRTEPPVALFVADMVAFGAGTCVGFDGWSRHNTTEEVIGFSVALTAWLPYWFVDTH